MIDWDELLERKLHAENDESSHVEDDPWTFHPSQLANCKRQCVISKCGLENHDTETLGRFKIGNMVHERLMEAIGMRIDGVEMEKSLNHTYENGVKVTGHCDAYDSHENAVYDFKTRSSWYKFDPPSERHKRQVALYAGMLGADKAQVVYICKKDLEVKTWPEDGLWDVEPGVAASMIEKAEDIAETLELRGIPDTVDEVPYDPCGCWICEMEVDDE